MFDVLVGADHDRRGDFSKSNFDVKGFLVVVPLVGSSIAVCWEVGTFLPICHGGWSCLSLTEHINRALQALPFGFGVCVRCYSRASCNSCSPEPGHSPQ
jgi:hypothetical protein